MRRFFKLKDQFNWKYVIGEILLIFIGINLAIWFNDWNSTKKTVHDKDIAITKIKEEIKNNVDDLTNARLANQTILNAFSDYGKLFNGNTSEVVSTPQDISVLQKKYPEFYRVKDSVAIGNGQFRYNGKTFIELEIPELTSIAWETTRSLSIINEFDYECLYELEGLYNLQRRVQNEIDKAANALQKREIQEMFNILDFMNQLDFQLKDSHEQMLKNIDHCR
ncbi:MAG: hypothetical protein DHS20C18_32130 [Saprospiraceae bacterium]|nr:MAG: hypothetical protein DHS20C18_32130 [Saprospiraceae bacterium]